MPNLSPAGQLRKYRKIREAKKRRFGTLVSAFQKLICIELDKCGASGTSVEGLLRCLRSQGYLSSRSPRIEQEGVDAFVKASTLLSESGAIRAKFLNNCCGQVLVVFTAVHWP